MNTYGEEISEEISEYLIKYSSEMDVDIVSKKTGIHPIVIYHLKNRLCWLTVENESSILELIRIANINCHREIQEAKEKYNKIINTIKL